MLRNMAWGSAGEAGGLQQYVTLLARVNLLIGDNNCHSLCFVEAGPAVQKQSGYS